MSPLPPAPARGRRRGPLDTLAVKSVTLAVVAACAILLWCFAGPRVGEAVSALRPPPPGVLTVDARVVACPPDDDAAPCRVSYGGATPGEADLVRVGLFDVTPGEELPVRVGAGQAVVTGWRPVLDAALLVSLAAAFTGYAVGRWRAVLDHDAPWSAADLDAPTPVEDRRGHREDHSGTADRDRTA